MSNLPEHWLINAAVVDTVLANGRVGRLLMEVLVEIGAVFPPRLVASVLKVIKRKDARTKESSRLLSLSLALPLQSFLELWNQPDYKEYWDDVNGGFWNPHLVREARLLELDWVKKEKVYDYRPSAEVREELYQTHSFDMGGH